MSTTLPPNRPDQATEDPSPVLTPPADSRTLAGAVPRLAPGIELIGRFEDSGFKEPPYIARRADGQVVQMPELLFQLAEEVDSGRPCAEIAERLSHRIERGVSPEVVEMLIEEQLRPLGVVAPLDGGEPELKKVDPLLALKFRAKVVPESAVRAITSVFRPLFWPPVVVAALLAMAALDAWLFFDHGIGQSLRHTIYDPVLLLGLLGCVALATAFHEVGHATACRYGGARPGVMGVGVYIVWPAFYTDITDAYRLDKRGRLRTDLGGMYFNAWFALAAAGLYVATGFEPLLLLVLLQNFAIIQQALPFLRLDGYYIVSDLTGVPDILVRIKPILASLVPWRRPDDRVTALKPRVRAVVTAYVALLVPVVAFIFAVMLIHAPRIFATAWDSFWVHYDVVGPALDRGQVLRSVRNIIEMAVLALPVAGFVYTSVRIAHRTGTGAWRWSAGSAPRRGAVVLLGTAALSLLGYLWWPDDDYRPIQPGEKGTIQAGFKSVAGVPSGQAALSPERLRELGGAPSERDVRKGRAERHGAALAPGDRDGSGTADSLQSPDGEATQPDNGDGSDPTAGSGTADPAPGGTTTQPGTSTTTTQPPPSGTTTQPAPTDTSTTEAPPPASTDGTSTTPTETTPTTTDTTATPPPASDGTTTTSP